MNTFDENKVNRQQAGTSAGGQFAAKNHPADDQVGLDKRLSLRAISRLNSGTATEADKEALVETAYEYAQTHETKLMVPARGDQLQKEDINRYLHGGSDEVEDWGMNGDLDERISYGLEHCTREFYEDNGISPTAPLAWVLREDVENAFLEGDTSDIVNELAAETHDQRMIHTLIDSYNPDDYTQEQRSTEQGRVDILEAELMKRGHITAPLSAEDRLSVAEVAEDFTSPNGGAVSAIWSGPITSANLKHEGDSRTVKSDGGMRLVTSDYEGGPGVEAPITVPFQMTFTGDNPARLDTYEDRGGPQYKQDFEG